MKQATYLSGIRVILLLLAVWRLQAQEEKEKAPIRIILAYYQSDEALPLIKVTASTKKNQKFVPVAGAEVNLFFNEETAEGFMGRVTTNDRGTASMTLPVKFKTSWDSMIFFKFIGTVTGNKQFEDEAAEIEITKARIELSLTEEDSIRTIKAALHAYTDSGLVSVPETDLLLVVSRLLSDIGAGEEEFYTTDENGEVSAPFIFKFPGDETGNIRIGAKIEDHELYGNLKTTQNIQWGSPLLADNSFAKRSLWATRDKTPIWLLIFPNLLIIGVWGTIIYLINIILKIRKLGKTSDISNN